MSTPYNPNFFMTDYRKITEESSRYDRLEEKSPEVILREMSEENLIPAQAVAQALPQITRLVERILPRLEQGGRIFYIGAGTSGRLGVLDASEIPPTFGMPEDLFIGLIAGGDQALRHPVENAEDVTEQALKDLSPFHPNSADTLIGITAAGSTPYVLHGIIAARRLGLLTGCITSNPGSPVTQAAHVSVVTVVGPEYVTGSSRLKSGTAQKMVLNMISTALMIKMGRVKGNKMVDMQLSNHKLIERGTRIIMQETGVSTQLARETLLRLRSVRRAIQALQQTQLDPHLSKIRSAPKQN